MPRTPGEKPLLVYFSLSLLVSSALLFLVQPLIGKMLLPHFGGSPAVWNTCMVFFQAMLLVGYGYVHVLTTTQPVRRQVIVQGLLLLVPLAVLPFALGEWEAPADANPVLVLLLKLAKMAALPFFMVATTAPLLQKWFAHTRHFAARDPYFLYAASNLGSLLGLALYPAVLEPWLPLTPAADAGWQSQVHVWTAGYLVFAAMTLGCAIVIFKQSPAQPVHAAKPERPEAAVTWLRRLRWLGLAAIPSSLMLGVTTYMTTDIAAVAFFWVLPLALYLLTYILAFARWPVVWTETPHRFVVYAQPFLAAALVLKMVSKGIAPLWLDFLIHLLAFFSTALLCHGELAKDRPGTRHLTEFYFWLSLGGMLGGLFNALLAPVLFQRGIWEYPIALVAACLLRPNLLAAFKPLLPGDSTPGRRTRLGNFLDALLPLVVGAAALHLADLGGLANPLRRNLLLAGIVLTALLALWRPLRLGLILGAILIGVGIHDVSNEPVLFRGRSFFGVVRVRLDAGLVKLPMISADDPFPAERNVYHVLMHGGINHGAQIVAHGDAEGNEQPLLTLQRRRTPTAYFHERNGVAEVFHKLTWSDAAPPLSAAHTISLADARVPAAMVGLAASDGPALGMLVNTQSEPPVAVLGLGCGVLACYAKPFQTMDFIEIDPLVRSLSIAPGHVPPWHPGRAAMRSDLPEPPFSFVKDAQERWSNVNVILGDGRLKIRDAPPAYYHILCLDVFSSDAIPVHLLTAEAIDLYMSKLVDGGVLICNTSNRHVRLPGILAAIARERDLECLVCVDELHPLDHPERAAAEWVVLQRRPPAAGFRSGAPPVTGRLAASRVRLAWNGQPVKGRDGAEVMETRWQPAVPLSGPIWSDRYSNLLDPRIMPALRLGR